MKACHVRFRGVAPTRELLLAIREHEAELQGRLDALGSCESVLLERSEDGRVRVTLTVRLGATMDFSVYHYASDPLGAVLAAFGQASRRVDQQTTPVSGVRSRPGLRRAGVEHQRRGTG